MHADADLCNSSQDQMLGACTSYPVLVQYEWYDYVPVTYTATLCLLQVFKAVDGMMTDLPSSEEAIKPIETLISEAYQEIDKAVGKGVLHLNTGARRKAKVAAAKRQLLIEAGLYSPSS